MKDNLVLCNNKQNSVPLTCTKTHVQFRWPYLLTYSMVQSPSWEANWFAASQEIPRISRNPTVHYRTHKLPSPVSILGQPNPVQTPTSHLLEIHPNIIHPSTSRFPQWSPSVRFPHQDPIHSPLLTHTHHMPSPSHSSRFFGDHKVSVFYSAYSRWKWWKMPICLEWISICLLKGFGVAV